MRIVALTNENKGWYSHIDCPYGCKNSEGKQMLRISDEYQYYEVECSICKKRWGYHQSS